MQIKPMIIIDKSGIVITPDAPDLLLYHTNFFTYQVRAKLDEYIAQEHPAPQDPLLVDTQEELRRAETIAGELTQMRGYLLHVYDWHFESLAHIFRETRVLLKVARIEDDRSLLYAVKCLMTMLKRYNPKFSEEKFIKYINN